MRIKPKVPWAQRFPRAAPAALKLLERLLAFDPDDRPTAEEALADPFFNGLADPSREPAAEVVSRTGYTFESKKLTREEVRSLLYREILEYHPQAKREFEGGEKASHFMYPSGAGAMGTDFAAAEEREAGAKGEETGMKNDKKRHLRSSQSLPRWDPALFDEISLTLTRIQPCFIGKRQCALASTRFHFACGRTYTQGDGQFVPRGGSGVHDHWGRGVEAQ